MKITSFTLSIISALSLSCQAATLVVTSFSDWSNPSQFVLEAGSNSLTVGNVGSNFLGKFVTLNVPVGMEVNYLSVQAFSGASVSFMGLQIGDTLTASPVDLQAPGNFDPINYILYGTQLNQNLLPTLVVGQPLSPATTLTEGTYALWFNETSGNSTSTMNFGVVAVPEPSALLLFSLSSLVLLRSRR